MFKIAAGCVLFALFYSTNVQCEIQPMVYTEVDEMCKKETGATAESIWKADHGEFRDYPALKCYYKCLMMKTGAMDATGHFNVEDAVAHALRKTPPMFAKNMEFIVRHCGNQVGSDPCDTALRIQKCYWNIATKAIEAAGIKKRRSMSG